MPGAGLSQPMRGKLLSYMPQPYRGKPAVRTDREGRGNVGIIRSPVRASTLPDYIGVKIGSALVEHKISASPPKSDICALMSGTN